MLKLYRQIVDPQSLHNNSDAPAIGVINTIAALTAADILMYLLRYLASMPFQYENAIQAGAIFLLALMSRFLWQWGYPKIAKIQILGGLWAVLSWSSIFGGGIQATGFIVLLLSIFAAGLLVNIRGLAVYVGGVLITTTILLVLQSTNQLPEPIVEHTLLRLWGLYIVLVIASGLFTAYNLTRINSALIILQEKERVLQQNNLELAAQHQEQTRIKHQLEQSKSLLESTFEAIADGVVVVDKNKKLVAINQKFKAMWDLPPTLKENRTNLLAHVMESVKVPKEYLAKVSDIYADPAAESHEQVELNDGRIYEWLSRPQRMGESIVGRVWTFRDITSLKKSEEAVRESNKRFREIFELAPIGMAIIGLDGQFIQVNKSLCQTFGYSANELRQLTISELTYPDDLAETEALMDKLINGELSFCQLEKRAVHQDGSLVDILVQISLISDKEKCPAYVISQVMDLTERKRSEEALRQAQKLESLGIMSGGIAHDFNNLLTGILAQSTLALSHLSPQSKLYGNVRNIVRATEKAADLTRQLLAYSGRGQFENKPINLNTIIEDSLGLADTAIASKATLTLELAESLPLTQGDAGQIQQVLLNLIMNAAEAVQDAHGIISISTDSITVNQPFEVISVYADDQFVPGDYVRLEVRDNGEGMDGKTLSNIFDPFFTTKMTGRGLGLAAVLGIIRGHGGTLQVESTVGEGTCFRLLLPMITEETTLEADVESNARSGMQSDLHFSVQSGTVLVIDDHSEIQQTVSEILSLEGIQTLTASTGATGVRLFTEQIALIDLILLDLTMPGLSGEETLLRLREIDAEIPIILTSGYSSAETAERITQSQATDFLAKPYSWEQLIGIIRQHL